MTFNQISIHITVIKTKRILKHMVREFFLVHFVINNLQKRMIKQLVWSGESKFRLQQLTQVY